MSTVPTIAILLFNGDIQIAKNNKSIYLNKWIQYKCKEIHAVLLKQIQIIFEQLLIQKTEFHANSNSISNNNSNDSKNSHYDIQQTLLRNLLVSLLEL